MPGQASANVAPVSNCRLTNFEDNEYEPEYTIAFGRINAALSEVERHQDEALSGRLFPFLFSAAAGLRRASGDPKGGSPTRKR
jgi:hypothetical protein